MAVVTFKSVGCTGYDIFRLLVVVHYCVPTQIEQWLGYSVNLHKIEENSIVNVHCQLLQSVYNFLHALDFVKSKNNR